jgi:ferritin-like metal-binding protein YciE
MAKSSKTKKDVSSPKSNAAYSIKENDQLSASDKNPSRYAPTRDAVMDEQLLGAEDGLLKLLYDSLKDLYWAENCLIKALPKMAKAASATTLQQAILTHLEQTKVHSERLEQAFEVLGKKVQAKKCDAMEGLTKEGESVIEDTDPGSPARDLGIIMASQKVEQFNRRIYNHQSWRKINDDQNTLKAGERGPSLLEDFIFVKRSRILIMSVYPKEWCMQVGSAAHGVFKLHEDMSRFTTAGFLCDTERETPVFVRFLPLQVQEDQPILPVMFVALPLNFIQKKETLIW